MNYSKDFQDAESFRSGNSHVTSRPVSFPPHPISEGMLSRSIGMPSRREGPPCIWDTHGISGNVFANPDASSSAPYPPELNQWSSGRAEPIHSSTVEKSERQTQVQDQRCQPRPSVSHFRAHMSSRHPDQHLLSWLARGQVLPAPSSVFPHLNYRHDLHLFPTSVPLGVPTAPAFDAHQEKTHADRADNFRK